MLKILALSVLLLPSIVSAKTLPATHFKSTQNFIQKMVEKHQFDKNELLLIFSKIEFTVAKKDSKNKVKPPKKKTMTWDKYKSLFITDERIADGLQFWKNNIVILNRAESTYNIPSEIIVAILGIETNYGQNKGAHPTLETLTKRAFGNYRRRNFYKKELESFLLMSRENALPPLTVKGSYAGAMGYPQFIASSYRHYAVDFNQDGKIDLFSDPVDAIGSIANYFDKHHWHDFGEIAHPITLSNIHLKHATRSTSKPKQSTQYWRKKGLNIDSSIHDKTKIAFIRLPQQKIDETWLTFWNFYVLTRYNHDNRYAMAAYQLSTKIRQKFKQDNN